MNHVKISRRLFFAVIAFIALFTNFSQAAPTVSQFHENIMPMVNVGADIIAQTAGKFGVGIEVGLPVVGLKALADFGVGAADGFIRSGGNLDAAYVEGQKDLQMGLPGDLADAATDFTGSVPGGWLVAPILSEYLGKFIGDATDAAMGVPNYKTPQNLADGLDAQQNADAKPSDPLKPLDDLKNAYTPSDTNDPLAPLEKLRQDESTGASANSSIDSRNPVIPKSPSQQQSEGNQPSIRNKSPASKPSKPSPNSGPSGVPFVGPDETITVHGYREEGSVEAGGIRIPNYEDEELHLKKSVWWNHINDTAKVAGGHGVTANISSPYEFEEGTGWTIDASGPEQDKFYQTVTKWAEEYDAAAKNQQSKNQ